MNSLHITNLNNTNNSKKIVSPPPYWLQRKVRLISKSFNLNDINEPLNLKKDSQETEEDSPTMKFGDYDYSRFDYGNIIQEQEIHRVNEKAHFSIPQIVIEDYDRTVLRNCNVDFHEDFSKVALYNYKDNNGSLCIPKLYKPFVQQNIFGPSYLSYIYNTKDNEIISNVRMNNIKSYNRIDRLNFKYNRRKNIYADRPLNLNRFHYFKSIYKCFQLLFILYLLWNYYISTYLSFLFKANIKDSLPVYCINNNEILDNKICRHSPFFFVKANNEINFVDPRVGDLWLENGLDLDNIYVEKSQAVIWNYNTTQLLNTIWGDTSYNNTGSRDKWILQLSLIGPFNLTSQIDIDKSNNLNSNSNSPTHTIMAPTVLLNPTNTQASNQATAISTNSYILVEDTNDKLVYKPFFPGENISPNPTTNQNIPLSTATTIYYYTEPDVKSIIRKIEFSLAETQIQVSIPENFFNNLILSSNQGSIVARDTGFIAQSVYNNELRNTYFLNNLIVSYKLVSSGWKIIAELIDPLGNIKGTTLSENFLISSRKSATLSNYVTLTRPFFGNFPRNDSSSSISLYDTSTILNFHLEFYKFFIIYVILLLFYNFNYII